MPNVNSSTMSRVECEDISLTIWLTDGEKREYHSVPEAEYLGLLSATSKGAYDNDFI